MLIYINPIFILAKSLRDEKQTKNAFELKSTTSCPSCLIHSHSVLACFVTKDEI